MEGDIYKYFQEKFPEPKEGDLQVYWYPQVPCEAFEWRVPNLEAASVLLDALAAYDDFQLANNIKPDYCNAGGLAIFEDGEWCDWYSEDGETFDEWRDNQNATV